MGFDPAAYTIVVTKSFEDGDQDYFAYVAELPDISALSDTYQEAYESCLDALEVLHQDAVEQGKSFPVPFRRPELGGFSGRVTLRMSRSMHAEVARCAQEDGVSLNQWIVEAISQRRGLDAGARQASLHTASA